MSEKKSNNKLYLKNIYELLGEHFYIPAYQRGYRWSTIQVEELLDDIWEFSKQKNDETSSFYCLQPIVVVKNGDNWQVVDGQQRLTTLFIILRYLENNHLPKDFSDAYMKELYSLKYETRLDSETFLQNIKPSSETKNIDFYHMAKALEAVAKWFEDKNFNEINSFLATLLAKPSDDKSVKVIWYDLSEECVDNDYAIDVFARINVGKIPLTNAELIKALFLQSRYFQKEEARLKQLKIASEWDAIEKQLQEPDFWHFIYNGHSKNSYETRIEYIFDLMKCKPLGAENFYTFHEFSKDFKNGNTDIDSQWKTIKNYFLTFDEWYRDRELYHLIGFLVDCDSSVIELKNQSEKNGSTKTEFKAYLKNEIRKNVNCQLDELNYGDSRIKKVLLLFNIQTLLATQEADVRFPFDRYKKEKWDIEHIRSQTEKEITGSNRGEWLEDVLEYFTECRFPLNELGQIELSEKELAFVKKISGLLSQKKIDDSLFKEIYQKIFEHFNEGETSSIDGLGNLALLDATTNRSYKNALFPIKRLRIIRNDMSGVFVPICTKNVFLKYYSKKLGDVMFWKESDADAYLSAIGKVLETYLPEQGVEYE